MFEIGICDDVRSVFPDTAVPDIDGYYTLSERWRRIYEGNPDWSSVKKSGLYRSGNRRLSMLNTAKVLCDRLAVLINSEEPEVIFSNEKYGSYVLNVLKKTGFLQRMTGILSRAYASGGVVFRPFINGGEVDIDCVYGSGFVPVEWSGEKILSGCFSSVRAAKGYYYTLYEMHSSENGVPVVEYRLYKSKDSSSRGKECPLSELYPMLEEKLVFDGCMEKSLFSCFRPCSVNNLYADVPMGISFFANAEDTLKAIDVAFDSFSREFVLGRKRIIVPSSCVQTVTDISTGEQRQYFDADDEAYVALKCDEERDLKITDNTVSLRVDEHIKAINALLDILCFQTGLSAGTFSFNSAEGVKTATEIISRDSRTASLVKTEQNNLSRVLISLFKAIIELGIYSGQLERAECDITVAWHDGIITDENTLIANCISLVNSGLKSKVTAIMEIRRCSYEAAVEEYERILKEEV
ncbi:MAG: phage portal protein [Oscillospiraceae bacterium]|nr:phage portal protein [Oscillospiraceae bacterium]